MSLNQVNGDSGSNPRLAEIRERIQRRLAEKVEQRRLRRERSTSYIPPRYDDVFFKGLEWLDSL